MSFISYARNFEDVMLWRALRHVDKGFYIDVGAGGPVANSVTCAFYERGWHGINLEPARAPHARLLVERPADINLRLVAGEEPGNVTFFEVDATELSTLDEARAYALSERGAAVVQRQLERQPMSAICARHAGKTIHFLKIDTAGSEQAVLAGLDLGRWRPWVLVVANTGAAAWEPAVLAAHYELAYNDGLNNFYIAAEHRDLHAAFATPPNPADGFRLRPDHEYAYPLTEWRERVERLDAAAAAAELGAHEARQWADARVREREQNAADRERNAAAREQLLTEMTERATFAEARVQELAPRLERAEHFEGVVNAIHLSSSWRVTRPLRSISFRARVLRGKARDLSWRIRHRIALLRRGFAGVLKGAVRRVIRAIMGRPAISYFVRSQLGRHPRLTNWLRVTVQRTQAAPPPVVALDNPADLEHLPSSARQVLADLRRTINNTRQQ
jgi:FkbM family methyltransferase